MNFGEAAYTFPEDTITKPNHFEWLVSIDTSMFSVFCLGRGLRPAGGKDSGSSF